MASMYGLSLAPAVSASWSLHYLLYQCGKLRILHINYILEKLEGLCLLNISLKAISAWLKENV